MAVPEILAETLRNVDMAEALAMWDYLDGNPKAIEEMIAELVDHHPGIETEDNGRS